MIDQNTLDAYRQGIDTGTMKSATPNVVRELLDEIQQLRAIVDPLNRLRADDETEVSFWCDKPDDPDAPASIVGIRAEWADQKAQDFYGETLAEALEAAEKARAFAMRGKESG